MDDTKYIVELRLPTGTPFRRSAPMDEETAKKMAEGFCGMTTFTAHVVPAEKYAAKGKTQQTERPEETGPNSYRSRVE